MVRIPQLLVASLALLVPFLPPCHPEYTVVMPDSSSTLVDAPQSNFSALARTDPAEQRAVYDIMAATGNGWASSIPDVCRGRWHGIECMPDEDQVFHVVSLSFGALSDDIAFPACDPAVASLSPALAQLPHIRSLFFYRCFTRKPQPIPAFLGHLGSTLRSLVLRENGHVGPIPDELGNLTSLKVLDLHGNNLGSSIPSSFAGLTRLHLLDLSNNQLTGAIPQLNLPALNVLDLNHNVLRGHIPSVLGKCGSLVKMDFSRNHLTGPIPDALSNLKSLILLDLSHNYLSGPLPSSLGSLSSLQVLILKGNSMKAATIPEDGFVRMKDLITLVLSDMGLQGPIPESIGKLPSLRVLHLDGNELNGSVPRSFGSLEKLSELKLDNNKLTGPIPFGRKMLWRMGRKLGVQNNSGLCYEASNGRTESIDSMSGISYCDEEAGGAASMRTTPSPVTKHLSLDSKQGQPSSHLSSSGPAPGYSFIQAFVSVAGVLLSVLPL